MTRRRATRERIRANRDRRYRRWTRGIIRMGPSLFATPAELIAAIDLTWKAANP